MNALIPLPSRQVKARRTLTTETLPTEILLHIISFLPASSIVCLSLTSKRHHRALINQFDPKMRDNLTEKARFLQLLENDMPEMMACYSCNILYRWHKERQYLCPDFLYHFQTDRAVSWYLEGNSTLFYRNMVNAFIRGSTKGSQYGPQLSELSCSDKLHDAVYYESDMYLIKAIDARVIEGKLLVHGVYNKSVSLSAQTSQAHVSQMNPNRVLPTIHGFRNVGCAHTRDTLPAAILDAFQLRLGCAPGRTRSLDLLNCGYCATDLRVRVDLDRSSTAVDIEVEIWKSFGGREPENRTKREDAHFSYALSHAYFDIRLPPHRNLEEMFNGIQGERVALLSPHRPRKRQSWIQFWRWYYEPHREELQRYSVPCGGDRVLPRALDQELPLKWEGASL